MGSSMWYGVLVCGARPLALDGWAGRDVAMWKGPGIPNGEIKYEGQARPGKYREFEKELHICVTLYTELLHIRRV